LQIPLRWIEPREFIIRSTLAVRAAYRDGTARMILLSFLSLVTAMIVMAGEPHHEPVVRRVVIHDEVIFRIPVRPRPTRRIEWIEKKGPKCVAAYRIAGAMLSGPSSIDFLLRDRSRVRAEMDSRCPALDFYDGFYLQPDDERICAKRETIRSRVGASCRIERFRTLVKQVKK
jgi:hypothetical protein